jgi:DNA-binding LacI/PurR family transcriptional regulator
LNASERAVREALGVLQREGWINRKNGVGTFVAESGGLVTRSASPTIIGIARSDASFFDRCIEVMYRRCDEAGLSLLCQPVLDESDGIRIMPSIANEVLGYVVFGYRLVSIARQLQKEGAKVVVIGAPGIDDFPDVPIIYNDHEHGGFLATNHLLELGHERVAFSLQGVLNLTAQRRWLGHRRAIDEARRRGQRVVDSVIEVAETVRWESDPASVCAFLQGPDAPTGIVMWNDYEAAKLLGTLTKAGIRVPDDVSLIGYDALPEVSLLSPPLTTVDHSIAYQVRTSVDLLLRPTPLPSTYTVVVVPSLLVRQSTSAPSR